MINNLTNRFKRAEKTAQRRLDEDRAPRRMYLSLQADGMVIPDYPFEVANLSDPELVRHANALLFEQKGTR